MAFIDLLIHETAHKFELGNKSIAVVSALISTMNNRELGGVEGFLDRFRKAGLNPKVNAWVNEAEQISLTADEVENSLEPSLMQSLCEKTGVNNPLLSEILAFLIPPIICLLSSKNLSFTLRPDEMRKALWSVSTEPKNGLTELNLINRTNISVQDKFKSTFLPLTTGSSVKSLGSRLLRSLPFLNF